jgi:hypothetical protein
MLFSQCLNLLKTFKVGVFFLVILISPFSKSAQQISEPVVGNVPLPALLLDCFPVEVGEVRSDLLKLNKQLGVRR